MDYDAELKIFAFDIDGKAIEAATENAIEAGVDDCIIFKKDEYDKTGRQGKQRHYYYQSSLWGNVSAKKNRLKQSIKNIKNLWQKIQPGRFFLITTDKTVEERIMGRPADRRRKLYNGRLEVCYYQFHGKKE